MDSRGPAGSNNGGGGRGRGGRNRRRGGRGGGGRGRGGDKQAPHRAHHEDAKQTKPRTNVCFDYAKGTCRRGDQCRFVHETANHDVVQPTAIPASGFDAMDVDAAPLAVAQPKDGSKKLAHIMCGGDVPNGTWVDEDHILQLEKEAFVSLCGEQKTLDRIQHMLTKGKPLRN